MNETNESEKIEASPSVKIDAGDRTVVFCEACDDWRAPEVKALAVVTISFVGVPTVTLDKAAVLFGCRVCGVEVGHLLDDALKDHTLKRVTDINYVVDWKVK